MMFELLDEQIEHLKKLGYEDPPKTADLSPERLDKLRIRWSHHKGLSGEDVENRAICQAVWEQRVNTNPQFVDANQPPVDNLFALARKLDGIAETIRSNKYPDSRPEINHVKEAVQDFALMVGHVSEAAETRDINSLEISRQIGAGIENAVRSDLRVNVLNHTDLAPILKFLKILTGVMIWAALLLMVMIGLSLRAHGQYSHINYIQFQNAGVNVTGGFFSYPFNFNFVGCTGAASGSTITLTCSGGGTGTVTNIATSTPITGGPITTTGTIACPTCVVASSPGAGLAHFAGSTQTVTSSAVSLTADVSGILPPANGGTGVNNTATLTLGSSNQNWAALGTGIVKNTTTTGALTNASSGDILGLCTTCVVASSPGVGIAHFAGSTQTVTSSAVNLAGADITGNLPAANLAAGTLATGMAAATGTAFAGTTNVATQAYVDAQTKPLFSTVASGLQSVSSNNTAIPSAVTMVTPASDLTYRFTFQVTQTTTGSGGTCNAGTVGVYLQYTDADTGVAYTVQVSPVTAVNMSSGAASTQESMIAVANGAATNWGAIPREFRAKSGVAVNYRVYQVTGSNCSTPPIFTVRPALYQLGY